MTTCSANMKENGIETNVVEKEYAFFRISQFLAELFAAASKKAMENSSGLMVTHMKEIGRLREWMAVENFHITQETCSLAPTKTTTTTK